MLLLWATRRTRSRPLIRVTIIRNPNSPHASRRRPAIRSAPPMGTVPAILRLAKLHLVIVADRIQNPTLARRRARSSHHAAPLALAVCCSASALRAVAFGLGSGIGRHFAAETPQQRAESGHARNDHAHVYLHDGPLDDCFGLCVCCKRCDGLDSNPLDDCHEEAGAEEDGEGSLERVVVRKSGCGSGMA